MITVTLRLNTRVDAQGDQPANGALVTPVAFVPQMQARNARLLQLLGQPHQGTIQVFPNAWEHQFVYVRVAPGTGQYAHRMEVSAYLSEDEARGASSPQGDMPQNLSQPQSPPQQQYQAPPQQQQAPPQTQYQAPPQQQQAPPQQQNFTPEDQIPF